MRSDTEIRNYGLLGKTKHEVLAASSATPLKKMYVDRYLISVQYESNVLLVNSWLYQIIRASQRAEIFDGM